MVTRYLVVVGLMISALAHFAAAGEKSSSDCIARVKSRIYMDKPVTVYTSDGENFSGRLLAANLKESILSIYRIDSIGTKQFDFKANEIMKIEYRHHYIKPHYLLFSAIGFLAGSLIGQFVEQGLFRHGENKIKVYPFKRNISYEDGAIVGGAAGALAGLIIPIGIGSKGTINCGQ